MTRYHRRERTIRQHRWPTQSLPAKQTPKPGVGHVKIAGLPGSHMRPRRVMTTRYKFHCFSCPHPFSCYVVVLCLFKSLMKSQSTITCSVFQLSRSILITFFLIILILWDLSFIVLSTHHYVLVSLMILKLYFFSPFYPCPTPSHPLSHSSVSIRSDYMTS